MRKNDYTSIEEFTSQYTGIWAPSEGHWYGLDSECQALFYIVR